MIRIRVRRGTLIILGLAFHDEHGEVSTIGTTNADNISGDTSSLSDHRIKTSVTPLDPGACLNVPN